MSRAFVKEGDEVADLPDRPVSAHPNLVTPEGLAALDAELGRWREAYAAAQRSENRDDLAKAARELRYWTARRASAQLTEPGGDGLVRFGATVSIERADGRRQSFRIVGEDEADPARGTVSYVSPLARALMGKGEGDTGLVAGSEVEVVEVG